MIIAETTMSGEPGPVRLLGLHERYSLMRQNASSPHIILHMAAYASDALPSAEFLRERVIELQKRLPMLSARLVDTKTNRPGLVAGAAWPADAIVREASFGTDEDKDAEFLAVFEAELVRAGELEYDGWGGVDPAPMWAVTRATSPNSPRGYLLIASNHIIADGRGTSSLVRALTASDITYIKQETLVGPTRIEETVQLKPSLSFLLPIAFRELFLTRMPYFVQKPFTRADPWPAAACDCSPMEVSEGFEVVTLDNDFVVALKAAGKARGVATLHPLLKVAYVAALWRVHASEAPAPARIQSSTARDERKPELGHAAITHNYVSSTEWDVRIGGAEVFWDMARELARAVSSPEGVAAGRMTMGLLSHIPDAAVDTSAANLDARKPTGWEDYFVRRVQSPTPYRDSMAMSNLGVVPLPPGADDYVWGQTASPFGSPYTVSILGHTGGVRVTSGFREGAVTDRERVKQLHTVFRNVLQRMVEGRDALTVAEITA